MTPTSTATPDLQVVLDRLRAASGAPAALVAIDDGDGARQLVSGTTGPNGAPLTATTTFRVGSITKTAVAALVLDATRRGELTLDAEVAALVPGVLRDGPPVTVRQLLSHTSGIFNAGDEGDVVADVDRLADPVLRQQGRDVFARYLGGEAVTVPASLYVAIAESHDRYFAPGAGYHYSNVNYQLAAMVLERVTGRSLPDLFTARLAVPLHLDHTAVAVDGSLLPDLHGFLRGVDGTLVDDTHNLVALGNGGSGGAISTPTELMALLRAIAGGDYLGDELTAEMRRPTAASHDSYGLGLATYHLRCGDFVGHGGSISGTNSIALVGATDRRALVAVVDIDTEPSPDMTAFAESLLCR